MKEYFFIFGLIALVIGNIIIQTTNIYFSHKNKKRCKWYKISIASFLGRILEKKYPLAKPILRILESGFLLYLVYLYLSQAS
ncbi:hypothetical protein SAMN02744037_02774 [Tepidibacter formicigenes DSM 15518]|uniref:Uncharacterized protein n=1 Tax=Tepidibacter formicigenes DSM 15518 TaxID=1123349 RepID=A0A1M6UCM6_9FIRM|nr:hypothetical protein SAMN02744037_02774 [Tepidibacter formicigenes DSM 15518]